MRVCSRCSRIEAQCRIEASLSFAQCESCSIYWNKWIGRSENICINGCICRVAALPIASAVSQCVHVLSSSSSATAQSLFRISHAFIAGRCNVKTDGSYLHMNGRARAGGYSMINTRIILKSIYSVFLFITFIFISFHWIGIIVEERRIFHSFDLSIRTIVHTAHNSIAWIFGFRVAIDRRSSYCWLNVYM